MMIDPSSLTIFKDSFMGVAFISLILMVGFLVRAYSTLRKNDLENYQKERELDRAERRADRDAIDHVVARFEVGQQRFETHNHEIFERVVGVTADVVQAVGGLKNAVENHARTVNGLQRIVENLQTNVEEIRHDRGRTRIEVVEPAKGLPQG
jgi:hypothetical protein